MNSAGNRLAIHAPCEDSGATGVNGTASDNSVEDSGALYIYDFDGTGWQEKAYIKASNTGPGDRFGRPVLSADGNSLVAGAPHEDSASTTIDGDQSDDSAIWSGAAYVFRLDGGQWSQQAYLKAPNTEDHDLFGRALATSSDGNIVAIAARYEDGSAVGIGGDTNNNDSSSSGAVYVFRFVEGIWIQAKYVKASNTDPGDWFGICVALSSDGSTMAVGATGEDSQSTGIGGDQYDDGSFTTENYGSVYLY